MRNSAEALTQLETCPRKAYFGDWEPYKLSPRELTLHGIRAALASPNEQDEAFGEVAGSAVMQAAEDRGLDTDGQDIYSRVIHIAALSDILSTAIRKPKDEPWIPAPPVQNWTPDCFISPDGKYLRRIVLVSHWSDERHYSECRNWFTLGEIAHFKLPMQIGVLVIGQERNGKRHTPWTSGFLHPMNHQLRFRKRSAGHKQPGNVFSDKWEKIWREDHAEISREQWLQSMLTDDVLRDVCFSVEVPVPDTAICARVREIAAMKLNQIEKMGKRPLPNLSSCHWPIPCPFVKLCHSVPEREPSEKTGYLNISEYAGSPGIQP